MTETVEQEAQAIRDGICVERGIVPEGGMGFHRQYSCYDEALCRLIEERRTMEADHQAFRKEVSDVAYLARDIIRTHSREEDTSFLDKFIIPPPVDPLVEAIKKALPMDLFEYGGTPRRDEVAEAIAQAVKIERTEA